MSLGDSEQNIEECFVPNQSLTLTYSISPDLFQETTGTAVLLPSRFYTPALHKGMKVPAPMLLGTNRGLPANPRRRKDSASPLSPSPLSYIYMYAQSGLYLMGVEFTTH